MKKDQKGVALFVNANEWKERKSALTEKWPKLQCLRVTTHLLIHRK